MGKKRKALKEALALTNEIIVEMKGPSFPGRAHKLKTKQLPKLTEILKDGLADG